MKLLLESLDRNIYLSFSQQDTKITLPKYGGKINGEALYSQIDSLTSYFWISLKYLSLTTSIQSELFKVCGIVNLNVLLPNLRQSPSLHTMHFVMLSGSIFITQAIWEILCESDYTLIKGLAKQYNNTSKCSHMYTSNSTFQIQMSYLLKKLVLDYWLRLILNLICFKEVGLNNPLSMLSTLKNSTEEPYVRSLQKH